MTEYFTTERIYIDDCGQELTITVDDCEGEAVVFVDVNLESDVYSGFVWAIPIDKLRTLMASVYDKNGL